MGEFLRVLKRVRVRVRVRVKYLSSTSSRSGRLPHTDSSSLSLVPSVISCGVVLYQLERVGVGIF